jgi:hypothetical protein
MTYRYNVQWTARRLHVKKKPSLLLKIDITRAFDSVAWPFLLELLQHMGFSNAVKDWISALLSSASTRILLNGNSSDRICHARGLCQGDPLSLMLFLLVMEVLNIIILKADTWSLFRPLDLNTSDHRASFYVDDLVWFVTLEQLDLRMATTILSIFEKSSGLDCNLSKCQMLPICCSDDQVTQAINLFPCQQAAFPIKYIGIPLAITKLSRSALQPLVEKVVDRLPIWKGHLLHQSGRLVLIKTMLSAIPIYTLISVALPPWLYKALRRIMTAFLWTGSDMVQRGKCLVAWDRVQHPLHGGGGGDWCV